MQRQVVGIRAMQELLNDPKVVVVEVLPSEDFEEGHIPGAVNVPESEPDFLGRMEQAVPEKQTPVVVYCSDVDCSASSRAARRLSGAGYHRVYEYEEGKKGWIGHGLSLEEGSMHMAFETRRG